MNAKLEEAERWAASILAAGGHEASLLAEIVNLRDRAHAAQRRVGDLKGTVTRWRHGQDGRPICAVMEELEVIAFSVHCYLNGVPGLYLQSGPDAAELAERFSG